MTRGDAPSDRARLVASMRRLDAALIGLGAVTLAVSIYFEVFPLGICLVIAIFLLASPMDSPGRLARWTAWLLGFSVAVLALGASLGALPSGFLPVVLMILLVGPVVGGPYLLWYRWSLRRTAAARSWPRAAGKIVSSFIYEQATAPIIVYTYMVDGRSYRKTRVRFGGTGGMDEVSAAEMLERYPAGADAMVTYNPARPGESVLEPPVRGPNRKLLWAATISVAAPIWLVQPLMLMLLADVLDAGWTAMTGHRLFH